MVGPSPERKIASKLKLILKRSYKVLKSFHIGLVSFISFEVLITGLFQCKQSITKVDWKAWLVSLQPT